MANPTATLCAGGIAMGGRHNGFTVLELMVVLAVVAVLTAIALPSIHEAQLKAKLAELPTNADGIRQAQIAYGAANNTYLYGDGNLLFERCNNCVEDGFPMPAPGTY